jgi:hypothetical protein
VDGVAARPVVGLFGAFDTGELGEVALRRILEGELARRRPDIDVAALAPFGAERPIPGDEGRPAQPLLPPARTYPYELDALIITGDVLGDDRCWAARYAAGAPIADRDIATLALTGMRGGREPAPSVIWFAVAATGGDTDLSGLAGRDVWARDEITQERLGGTAVQSGDPLLLAGRVFPADVLRRRADLLRLCGAVPAGRRLVIEVTSGFSGSPAAERLIDALGAALRADPKLSAVLLTMNPTMQPLTETTLKVQGLIAERVHHLPAWAGLDDIAATMSRSAAVVATSPAGAHLAASLGASVSVADATQRHRLDPAISVIEGDMTDAIQAMLAGAHPVAIDAAVETLEGALTELAERLPRDASAPRNAIEPDRLGSALAILQQRLVDERTALQAELSRLQAELDHLRASPEHRIARPLREGYQRWQRRRT